MILKTLAAIALVPAMAGPALGGSEGAAQIVLALCNGGQIAIPMGDGVPAEGVAPCCAKGCHRSEKRRLLDLRQ